MSKVPLRDADFIELSREHDDENLLSSDEILDDDLAYSYDELDDCDQEEQIDYDAEFF